MKNPLLLSAVALALSAITLLALVLNPPDSFTVDPGGLLNQGSEANLELLAQVASLSAENQDLRDRITQLEMRPNPETRLPSLDGFATEEDLAALRSQIQKALASGDLMLDANAEEGEEASISPQFTERVAAAMKEIERKESLARNAQWVDQRSKRLQDRMAAVSDHLALDGYQQSKMQEALQTLYQAQADIKFSVDAGQQDPTKARGSWQAATQTLMDNLGEVLNETQWTLYQDLGGDLFPGGSGDRKK